MIYLQISIGRGPVECSLALQKLTQRILKAPGAMLVRSSPYSSVVSLDGSEAETHAQSWEGTILWICEDPLTSNRKRKNWYIGIERVELPRPTTIEVKDTDLKWETKKASGKGGQHVNKTESSVRLTHIPTGMSVISEDERSQHRNKAIALERLRKMLKDQKAVQLAMLDKVNWAQHNRIVRGNPIRTFIGKEFTEKD